ETRIGLAALVHLEERVAAAPLDLAQALRRHAEERLAVPRDLRGDLRIHLHREIDYRVPGAEPARALREDHQIELQPALHLATRVLRGPAQHGGDHLVAVETYHLVAHEVIDEEDEAPLRGIAEPHGLAGAAAAQAAVNALN